MDDSSSNPLPQTQPASAGGPPRPPNRTTRGTGDEFPDDFFGPEVSVIELEARDRWQAIGELVDHLVAANKIPAQHGKSVSDLLGEREAAQSTGIGNGIGIPHCSAKWVSELVRVIGRSKTGIEFDACDGRPVHWVFLFLVPDGRFEGLVHEIAKVSKLLHRREVQDGLSDRFL